MIDIDKDTACRICLEDGATNPLFESNENSDAIHAKLAACIKEKIQDIEGYPRNICIKCKNTSEMICSFINKFEETCKILDSEIVTVKTEYLSDDDNDNNPLVYDIQIDKIMKANEEQSIEKKDPTELLGSLTHLTIKRIKVNESETKDNCSEVKDVNRVKQGRTKDTTKAKKVVKKPVNGKQQPSKGPYKPLRAATVAEQDVRLVGLNQLKLKNIAKNDIKVEDPAVPPLPNLCDLCGEKFSEAKYLASHKQRKHAERNFKCNKCPKDYVREKELNDHIRRQHENVRNATCDTCGKAFYTKKHLKQHILKVHQKNPLKIRKIPIHKCKFCERTYTYKRGIVLHERSVHTGERPSVCSVCGSKFYDHVYLAEHMRIHTGDNPFKCPVCGRGYTQRGNMKSHMRNHKISELDADTLSKLKPNYFKFMRP